MKLPAGPSGALDDDDAASLEASLLEDVAPPEREKEDNTVAILCAAGAVRAPGSLGEKPRGGQGPHGPRIFMRVPH